jgi:hypothetical protein
MISLLQKSLIFVRKIYFRLVVALMCYHYVLNLVVSNKKCCQLSMRRIRTLCERLHFCSSLDEHFTHEAKHGRLGINVY